MSVTENARTGATIGLVIALIYAVVAVGIYVAGGSDAFARKGLTLGSVVAFYVAAGLVSGAIAGVLRPLAAHALGAMFVGAVAATPAAVAMGVLVEGTLARWGEKEWFTVGIMVLLFGVGGGYSLWSATRSES